MQESTEGRLEEQNSLRPGCFRIFLVDVDQDKLASYQPILELFFFQSFAYHALSSQILLHQTDELLNIQSSDLNPNVDVSAC